MSQTPMYAAQQLSFHYQLGAQQVPALHDIDLTIPKGSFIAFTGPSGSGKSTLLNVLGLIEPVQQGSLVLAGMNLAKLNERARNHIRRHRLGFIFQTFHLLDVLDAYENVAYFLVRQGVAREERHKRIQEALTAVGLWEHRRKRPGEMSGGQRQRVAIARALAKQPEVIIADEPTASLDQENGRQVLSLLRDAARQQGVTVLTSSHDPMVRAYADQEVKLADGRLLT